jgi:hypothetical protein
LFAASIGGGGGIREGRGKGKRGKLNQNFGFEFFVQQRIVMEEFKTYSPRQE